LPELDVGGSDDVQVSGFFEKEILGGERTYRWSGACGSIYLPAARPGTTIAITAAMGPRAAEAPAEVRVSLGGIPLGAFAPGAGRVRAGRGVPGLRAPGAGGLGRGAARAAARRPGLAAAFRFPRARPHGGPDSGGSDKPC